MASRGQDGRRSERGLGQKQHINDVPSIAILDAGSTSLPNRKVRRGAGERSWATRPFYGIVTMERDSPILPVTYFVMRLKAVSV